MSTRKTTVFYVLLTAVASFAVALVIASRLDLTPVSSAQGIAVPSMNSAPIGGPVDALTFRNIAKAQSPAVVNIRTEMREGFTKKDHQIEKIDAVLKISKHAPEETSSNNPKSNPHKK